MKKIFLGLSLLMAGAFLTTAYAQASQNQNQTRVKFFYYPSSNIYYNESTSEYWYNSGNKWVLVKTLPGSIVIEEHPAKYTVYYNGADVWKDNDTHKTKYKIKKDGTIKVKPKDN